MRVWVWRAFAQGEAYVSAEPERERGHGVSDSVPDEFMPPPTRLDIPRLISLKLISLILFIMDSPTTLPVGQAANRSRE